MATYPTDILRDLKDTKRRVQNLETTPQPPNIRLTDNLFGWFTIKASGIPGDMVQITALLSDNEDNRLLPIPFFTFYKDNTIDAAHQWPFGSAWSDAERRGLEITHWMDWGDTDNNNAYFKILLINNHSSDFVDLAFNMNFRYMTRGATAI